MIARLKFTCWRLDPLVNCRDEYSDIPVIRNDPYGRRIKINVAKLEYECQIRAIWNRLGLGGSIPCGIVSALHWRKLRIYVT